MTYLEYFETTHRINLINCLTKTIHSTVTQVFYYFHTEDQIFSHKYVKNVILDARGKNSNAQKNEILIKTKAVIWQSVLIAASLNSNES